MGNSTIDAQSTYEEWKPAQGTMTTNNGLLIEPLRTSPWALSRYKVVRNQIICYDQASIVELDTENQSAFCWHEATQTGPLPSY